MNIIVASNIFEKGRKIFETLNQKGSYRFLPIANDEPSITDAILEQKAHAFIAGTEPYHDTLYQALPKGGIISRFGVGHDSIDKELANKNGLLVTNTPGVLDNAVAEHACWMMGSLARHIHSSHHNTIQGCWEAPEGIELQGRKVTILGFGRIGQKLCRKLSFGFEMEVTAVGTRPESEYTHLKESTGYARYSNNPHEAVAEADFVILLMASTVSTRHIANASLFSSMKPSAVLINSARGAVLNEIHLYDALNTGVISAAGLDVFEVEPYVPQAANKDLRTLKNVLLTPHIGSNTAEANASLAAAAAQNVITILKYGPAACPNIINR